MTVKETCSRLYEKHRSSLLSLARRNSATDEDAEEALHDAFILFMDRYDPGSGAPPLAWLTLTLKRRCWAIYERRREFGTYTPRHGDGTAMDMSERPSPDRDPISIVEGLEKAREGAEKLKALKPAERQVLGLIGLGYSYREIERMEGWSYTKINRHASKGRAALASA